ncbi:MAG TPA: Hsp20/alpha crystallin family protein [Chthonomonadaceae bacterium]|nr:Hsp20/alpha crystallin family protein [Chthonomonadaceae bacterium]
MASRDFNPLDIFLQLENDMRRSVEEVMRATRFQPSVDLFETTSALVVKMEVAGVRPEKLQIVLSADDRLLTVSGERAEPWDEQRDRIRCYQLEIYFGPFERQIVLPAGLRFDRDQIAANYRDGFLVISLPKRPDTPRSVRVIEVGQEE